jgi:glycosyltransferase involved in cell wall biosynthesis
MKVCIICFDYKKASIRLQPWRYINEISKGMASKEIDVEIITDGYPALPKTEVIDGITVHRLRRLTSLPFRKNDDLIKLINKSCPDIILWTMGPTSFYFLPSIKRINIPILCLWMVSKYSLRHIMRLGFGEIRRNFQSIYFHGINSIIPSGFVRHILSNSKIFKVIVLNQNNRNSLQKCGVPPNNISVVPPGIGEFDLKAPNQNDVGNLKKRLKIKENDFIVMYIGSPLSLRGVDTLINGVSIASKDIPSLKLIILSRRRKNELVKDERYAIQLSTDRNIDERIQVISAFLSKDEIKGYIGISDVVALPFKLVQSDTPISILEVMALGKPVMSTKLDGIPELLNDNRGILIEPNDPQDLASALISLSSNDDLRSDIGERAKKFMLTYPSWDQTTENIINIINEVINNNPNK